MRIVTLSVQSSLAGVSNDPTLDVLLDQIPAGRQLSVTQVSIPAGSSLREHDHGDAEVLLVPLTGEVVARSGNQRERLAPGAIVLLPRGERVEFANESHELFTMVMVLTDIEQPTDGARWLRAGPADQVEDDTAMHVDLQGHALCIARNRGQLYALRDECSHGQVQLSEGEVEHGYVECWMHGSRFDLRTGIPACLPATQPVAVYPIRVTDGEIEIALPE